jgi:plastocyanin
MSRALFLPVLVLLSCSVSADTSPPAREPLAHTVVIDGMQFKPATLTIDPGDSVTWVNKDIVAHTVTAPASAKQPFDSQSIGVGKTWKRSFSNPGAHDYLCTYHPTMKGVIEVRTPGSAAHGPGA